MKHQLSERKKIAFFSGYYLPFLGGIERYTSKLAAQLKVYGYDVVIVTTNHASLPSYEKGDFTVYRLPTYSLFKLRYPLPKKNGEYKDLIKHIENENIDYYICNTRFQLTTLVGARLAKKKHKQAVIIEHGSSHFSIGIPLIDTFGAVYEHALTALVKKYVKKFYGVSKQCNRWLKHFRINAKGVFYNAVDIIQPGAYPTKYTGAFKGKTVITYAGRIIKEKGIELLLQSFHDISERHKDLVLVIAGDGPLLEQMQQKYNGQNIYFEGKLDYENVMALFVATDIFCHPSMFPEGLPTAILEAGLMGCAVVATDRGGTREVIINSDYGIIVDENRTSLTSGIEELLGDRAKLEKLKHNLHKRVKEHFSWDGTADCVKRELEKLDVKQ